MNITRRGLLGGGAALAATVGGLLWLPQASARSCLISCVRRPDGRHAAVAVNLQGHTLWAFELPGRGHDVELSPDQQRVAVFPRRPGQQVWILDTADGRLLQTLHAPSRHQFNGHGVFSPDGQWLYVVETGYGQAVQGQVAVYDSRSGQRLQAWDSAGLDPHQCGWCDGVLVVANGGYIEPEQGDAPKVLDPSRPPNLAWLDPSNGKLLRRDLLADPELSIRHLDVAQGQVFVGFQHHQGATAQAPLMGMASLQQPLRPLAEPAMGWKVFQGYIGSVAVAAEPGLVVATSPRGNAVGLWDVRDGAAQSLVPAADVCGAGSHQGQWISTTGHGQLLIDGQAVAHCDYAFDNHLALLG